MKGPSSQMMIAGILLVAVIVTEQENNHNMFGDAFLMPYRHHPHHQRYHFITRSMVSTNKQDWKGHRKYPKKNNNVKLSVNRKEREEDSKAVLKQFDEAFEDMLDFNSQDNQDQTDENLQRYHTILSELGKKGNWKEAQKVLTEIEDDSKIHPTVKTYSLMLYAWSRSDHPSAVHQMQQVWNRMLKLSINDPTLKPNLRTVATFLLGISRNIDNVDDKNMKLELTKTASALLSEIKELGGDLKPDAELYTLVMVCLSKIGTLDTVNKVEELMQELKHEYKESGFEQSLAPTYHTYTTLIGAWGRSIGSKASDRALELLEEMEQIHEKQKMDSEEPLDIYRTTKPSMYTYICVLHCLTRSNGSAKQALDLLLKMREISKEDPDLTPTLRCYNLAIECCARTDDRFFSKTAAAKIAFAILKVIEKEEGMTANNRTYNRLIRVVCNLLPPGPQRNEVGAKIIEKAKNEGQVTPDIIDLIHSGFDPDFANELLKSNVTNEDSFTSNETPRLGQKMSNLIDE